MGHDRTIKIQVTSPSALGWWRSWIIRNGRVWAGEGGVRVCLQVRNTQEQPCILHEGVRFCCFHWLTVSAFAIHVTAALDE